MVYIFDPIRNTFVDDEDTSLGNKLALNDTSEEIIRQIDEQFGPGTVFPASELPPKENPYKDFEDRNPAADGGMMRQNFYKGELVTTGPNAGKYKVKFPGISIKTLNPALVDFPDIYFETQFGTEEEINQLIADRKKLTEANIKAKVNPEKILGEKTLKALVDDTFAKGDFENFKIKLDPSKIAAAEKKGKTRTDTGGKVPSQYLTKFNKAIEAGPGSELFKELMNITGRTEQELLELDAKRPGGKVNPKLRSERALEYGGVDRRLTDEELRERGKLYARTRAEKESVGKKYASSEDILRFNTVNNQKKDLNKFFKNNPNAINTTEFGKNIKALMETRLDKEGNIIRRTTDSKGNTLNNEYYKNLAERGQIFDIFDINKISKGQRSTKFATNLNIMPSQFNSAFIEGQVNKFFKEGGKFYGDTEKLNKVSDYLKSLGVRVDIENVGRIGADMGVAYDSKTGQFPHIYKTLKKMNIPDSLLTKINPTPEVEGTTLKEKIQSGASAIKNKMDASRMLTSKIPGGAIALTPLDFTMSMMAGVPLTDAAASAGSYLLKDPVLGRAVNIPLALREMTDYGSEEEMLQRATQRREQGEEFLQGLLDKVKEGAGDQPDIDPFQAAEGGRVGFNGGGAVGADEDFAKELEYFLLNPDAELPKADSYRETMNPVALLNDMIDPRNYAYYADRLAETGIRIGEFGARVLPALGQLTADLIQRPAFKVTGGTGQGYVQDYTDVMPSNIKGTGIFTEFLDNLVGTEGTKVITEKIGLDKLIKSEEQKQKDRRSTVGPKVLADQVTLGAELTAPIFPGLKLLKAYAKNRKLPVNDTTKEVMEKEIDEVLSTQNLTRRDFLKATGAGGAVILAKMLGFGDELATTTKVAEKVAKDTVGGTYPPPYFFKLVDKIKFMGDDVTEKAATKDREVVKRYKEYEMSEDVATGEITIVKRNEGSFYDQDGILSEEYIIYKPGMADETTKGTPPPEYEEFTVRPDSEGKLKDSEDGLDSLEEILEEVGDPDSLTLKK